MAFGKRSGWFLAMLCAFVIVALPGITQASLVELGIDQLAGGADSIVTGEVVDKVSYWNDDHTTILTDFTVRVDSSMKQSLVGEVTVTAVGGVVGDIGLSSSIMVDMEVGEKTVLFLSGNAGGAYGVVGAKQGKMTIDQDGMAVKFNGQKTPLLNALDAVRQAIQ